MKKNVAGQRIGAQMVAASDGSEFTGTVTVYVTLDAGTQAIGTVGSGVCTHEGHGYHTYAPSQAETNGDLNAYTFVGTGAVPATVQLSTTFPQSADVGVAVVGSRVAADVTALDGVAGDATRMRRGAASVVTFTIGSGSTTISFVTSVIDPAATVTNQFRGKSVNFEKDTTTAALRGQSVSILDSTVAGVLNVSAATTSPVNGDKGTIT